LNNVKGGGGGRRRRNIEKRGRGRGESLSYGRAVSTNIFVTWCLKETRMVVDLGNLNRMEGEQG